MSKLTMRPTMTSRTGATYQSEGSTTQMYEILGMPDEQGWIQESDGKWRVLRSKGGRQTRWPGEFDSPEEALAALQEEFD